MTVHDDVKRIHSFKFDMEIAKTLKFYKIPSYRTKKKNVVNRAIKVTCIHTNGEVHLLKTCTAPSLTLDQKWLESYG